jgi:hypothetical protein
MRSARDGLRGLRTPSCPAPQPEAGVRAGGEPDSVVLAGKHAQAEDVDVEALEAGEVLGLERELGEAVGRGFHLHQAALAAGT